MNLDHIIGKARDAATGGFGVLSTGEKVVVALVLNRPDWLAQMGYTLAEAIDRAGADVALISAAARALDDEQVRNADAEKAARDALALVEARRSTDRDVIDCTATLVTYGSAPGYRDASFTFDLLPIGAQRTVRVDMRLRPEDGEAIVRHIRDVHELAWRRDTPLDMRPGEPRPRWFRFNPEAGRAAD